MSLLERLFGSHVAEKKPQRFNDLHWGTTNPVMVPLGGKVVGFRAWGSLSCEIADPQVCAQSLGDMEDEEQVKGVQARLRSVAAQQLADALGEVCSGKADASEVAAVADEITAAVKARLVPAFARLGLSLEELKVERITPA